MKLLVVVGMLLTSVQSHGKPQRVQRGIEMRPVVNQKTNYVEGAEIVHIPASMSRSLSLKKGDVVRKIDGLVFDGSVSHFYKGNKAKKKATFIIERKISLVQTDAD